jgi:hypothetical protein
MQKCSASYTEKGTYVFGNGTGEWAQYKGSGKYTGRSTPSTPAAAPLSEPSQSRPRGRSTCPQTTERQPPTNKLTRVCLVSR